MKRPNFFIIGAPKCGTSALARWLAEHPEVYFSPRKEPHFFNMDGLRSTADLAAYEALFEGASTAHKAVGEGSTHYLYSREAVPRILDYAPDARFIVCLRNPLEMAPALHGERLKQGRETVRRFEQAWRLQPKRRRGQHIPPTLRQDPERLQYGAYCQLGTQMERLLATVSPKRVLPVLLDDIRTNASTEYRRVLSFLGLRDDGRSAFSVVNAGTRTRSPALSLAVQQAATLRKKIAWLPALGLARRLRSYNQTSSPREPLPARLHAELQNYFREDVDRLSTILNRDLSDWMQ